MKNIKFSKVGKNVFLISWIIGTLILLAYCITKSWFFVWLGFYYVVVAFIVNMIVFFSELLTFITEVADKKPHGNSAMLLLLNIPVTILYISIVFNS